MSEAKIRHVVGRETLPLSLRDLAMPVFRQRRLAALVFCGIFAGVLLSALLLPRKYEAEMKILVNRDRVDAVITPGSSVETAVAPVSVVSEEDLNSEVELIKSRDLLDQVVIACGLLPKGAAPQPRRLAEAVQALDRRLIVEPLKKTTMIRVAYVSRDPELSAHVLATLAALYQEKHAAVRRPAGTFTFFDQQTARYQNELAAAEARLTDFDAGEGAVAPEEQKNLALQQLSQFEADWRQDEAGAYAAAERARALRAQAAARSERQTTQIKKLDNAQLLSGLQNTLLALELKRSEMLTKYAPTYPPVQDVEMQIAQTRQAIAQAEQSPVEEITTDRAPAQDWIETELAKAEADRAQMEARAAATARVVRHYQQTAALLDRKAALQSDLLRNVKAAEDNYLLYLHKREEARISDALDSKKIVNVSIAEAPTVPALPTLHLGWLLVSGFFGAGLASIGVACAADRLDPSFRTPEELGRYLDMAVLASIPASTGEARP